MESLKIYQFGFWKNYLIQMRPYLFFISGISGLVGMAFSGKLIISDIFSLLLFISFCLSYGFGQALTDCYQVDTDSISSPYRPLSSGLLSNSSVKKVSVIGLVSITIILIYSNPYNLVFCFLSVLGLISYTYVKKNYWLLGPPHNSWIVALLPIMGYLSLIEGLNFPMDGYLVLLVTFFSYFNFVLIGYLKDVSADRATGYNTFPVRFGWDMTIWVGDFIYIISITIYTLLVLESLIPLIIGIVAFTIALTGQVYAHLTKEKNESRSTYPILSSVRHFILIHCGLAIYFEPKLSFLCIVFYLLFEVVSFMRPVKGQI